MTSQPVLKDDNLVVPATQPRLDVFAQLAKLFQRDARYARLQVEQAEVFAVLLLEHLQQVGLVAVGAPVAVLIVETRRE